MSWWSCPSLVFRKNGRFPRPMMRTRPHRAHARWEPRQGLGMTASAVVPRWRRLGVGGEDVYQLLFLVSTKGGPHDRGRALPG